MGNDKDKFSDPFVYKGKVTLLKKVFVPGLIIVLLAAGLFLLVNSNNESEVKNEVGDDILIDDTASPETGDSRTLPEESANSVTSPANTDISAQNDALDPDSDNDDIDTSVE